MPKFRVPESWQDKCAAAGLLWDKRNRMFRLFIRRTTKLAKKAHPETGGNECLCLNWGNPESNRIWKQGWERWNRISEVLDRRGSMLWEGRKAA